MPADNKEYLKIVSHYESCLDKHGDTYLGVDWPNGDDAEKRYQVMLDIVECKSDKVTLLDFGCGASHFYDHIVKRGYTQIEYSGLDLSDKFINLCKTKYPKNKYYCADILDEHSDLPNFDYIIMNGVFTEKRELSYEDMFNYFRQVIDKAFNKAEKGIAFNVMSKHVDWERKDLFHLQFDQLASFLCTEISRNFMFRNDYGLYEYTTYVYKQPTL